MTILGWSHGVYGSAAGGTVFAKKLNTSLIFLKASKNGEAAIDRKPNRKVALLPGYDTYFR